MRMMILTVLVVGVVVVVVSGGNLENCTNYLLLPTNYKEEL
jgi:hypothetical protein